MTDIYEDILLNAIQLARQAGIVHMSHFRKAGLGVEAKLNESDIVTVSDKEAERVIIDGITALYPGHSILSEESGRHDSPSDFRWVIDPLDGTTNFSSGLPAFSVSIGVEHKGETIVGVVYAPYLNELFTAVKGCGAMLNGEPIAPRRNALLERAVVATGFPVDKNVNPDNNMDNLGRVLPLVRGVRRLGSAALDLSYVAAGFLDAYWECNLHPWDVCAGLLIVSEAGGRWRNYRDDRNVSVVVASPDIFDAFAPLIR